MEQEQKIMPSKVEFLNNLKERFAEAKEVKAIADELTKAGYEAYLVGGCLRDLLLSREPKDWDIATNAKPEEIQKVFPDSVYENKFGTVLVKLKPQTNTDATQTDTDMDSQYRSVSVPYKSVVVEVTTFRLEGKYTDKRHPDEIKFAGTVDEDLSRRDFTVNALALNLGKSDFPGKSDFQNVVDPFDGRGDLKKGIIRTVGNPEERFSEDSLRLMRAVRFATELGAAESGHPEPGRGAGSSSSSIDWQIESNTRKAIEKLSGGLEMIAKERIRDEFVKILEAPNAAKGIYLLEELNLLRHVLPELREGLGVGQNKHHIYEVFEHNVRALDYAAKKDYSLIVRLASLLHDVGKPKSKRGDGPDSTFYQHEYIGARIALKALDRLRFSKDFIEKVVHLVRYHLFYYNVGEVTEAGVRRFLARVGPENVPDLLKVREADRIGSGVPKAFPYKLRHLLFMIEKVKQDPISPKMLKVRGDEVMKILGIEPGPKVGQILAILLEEVIDDPKENTKEDLESRIKNLGELNDKELIELAKKARERKEEFETGVEEEIKEKYHVK